MKKNNVLKIFLLCLVVIILLLVLQSTYSKYLTSTENQANLHISKWKILVNDQDISENADFTENLELVFDENPNIAEGVVVPKSKFHFEIELNSTGTELPFEYRIKVLDEEFESLVPDFQIVSYSINGEETIEIPSDQTEVVGTVEPAKDASGNITDDEVINTLYFNVEWYDEEDNILNNKQDVLASKSENPSTTIPIELKLTQIIE